MSPSEEDKLLVLAYYTKRMVGWLKCWEANRRAKGSRENLDYYIARVELYLSHVKPEIDALIERNAVRKNEDSVAGQSVGNTAED